MGQLTQTQADKIDSIDKKAKVSSGDTTAGYVLDKLVNGAGITLTKNNPGANETVSIKSSVPYSYTEKVTASDTTPGYLNDKIIAGAGVVKTLQSPGANERILLSALNNYLTIVVGDIGVSNPAVGSIVMRDNLGKLGAAVAGTGIEDVHVLGIRAQNLLMSVCGFQPVTFTDNDGYPQDGSPCFVSEVPGKATCFPRIDHLAPHIYIGLVAGYISVYSSYVALNIQKTTERMFGKKRTALYDYIILNYGSLSWCCLNNIPTQPPLASILPFIDDSYYFLVLSATSSMFMEYKSPSGPIDSCLKLKKRTAVDYPSEAHAQIQYSSFPCTSPMTHLIWVRYDVTDSGMQRLITVWDGVSQGNYCLAIDINGSGGAGFLGFSIKTNSGTYTAKCATATYLPAGSWKLLGLTYDASLGSNQLKAFVNCAQVDQVTTGGTIRPYNAFCSLGDTTVSRDSFPGYSVSASFAEYMAFPYILTAAQQLAIYNLITT